MGVAPFSDASNLVAVPCPSCGRHLRLSTQLEGLRIRCLDCRHVFAVRLELDSQQAKVAVQPGAWADLCPECASYLRLVPELHGHSIRCQECRAVLRVSARPRGLETVQPPDDPAPSPPAKAPAPSAKPTADRVPAKKPESKPEVGAEPLSDGPETEAPPAGAEADGTQTPQPEKAHEEAAEAPVASGAVAPEVEAPGSGASESAASAAGALAAAVSETVVSDVVTHDAASPEATSPKAKVSNSAVSEAAAPQEAVPEKPKSPPAQRWPMEAPAPMPAKGSTERRRLSLVAPAVCLLVVGLIALGGWLGMRWWMAPSPALYPEARYLPQNAERFISLSWPHLLQGNFDKSFTDSACLGLIDRCRMFIKNAQLNKEDVERISAGGQVNGGGTLLVYFLKRPVNHEEMMNLPAFRTRDRKGRSKATTNRNKVEYEKSTVRGVPVYTHLGSCIAFPEDNVIVNGDAAVVAEALSIGPGSFQGPTSELLEDLDFSATVVRATSGRPSAFSTLYLHGAQADLSKVRGTIDCLWLGPTLRAVRILRVDDAEAARRLAQAMQASLKTAGAGANLPEPVREVRDAVKVSAKADPPTPEGPQGGSVRIELEFPTQRLHPQALAEILCLISTAAAETPGSSVLQAKPPQAR